MEQNKAIEKFIRLSETAESLDENNPMQLIQKMQLYGHMLDVVKDLATASKNDAKKAYSDRKRAYADSYLRSANVVSPHTNKKLTSAERKEYAEMMITKYREREADLEQEAEKWKYTFEMLVEQINIMKYRAKGNGSIINNAVY